MLLEGDRRGWAKTDREGEQVTAGRAHPGCELLSATGSMRLWSEPVHESFTIAIVHRGARATATEWRTRGRSVTTEAGELMSINPGDGHATLRVHAPSDFDAVKLAPQHVEDAARAAGIRGTFWLRSPACNNPRVFAAVRRLVAATARRDDTLSVEATSRDLANAIVRELGETRPSRDARTRVRRDWRLERVRECLHDRARGDRPSLLAISCHADLGRSQLCALFKDYYGVSIAQYALAVRIARAEILLLEGTPAKTVAADLGFVDQAHLSRHFRRRYGMAPGAWVALYRSNSGRRRIGGT
jgi:AraC-like DNA-binding protein